MGRGKIFSAALLLAVACGSGKPAQQCDPQTDESCNIGTTQAHCSTDADCGDGKCMPDGTCQAGPVQNVATACASITCPSGQFCSNGQCIPATPQCGPANPACIYIPHGAFEQPAHAWWWPWATPDGPNATSPQDTFFSGLEYPDYVQVMSTPVVVRLHPADTEPAVVFNTFPLQPTGLQGSEMLEVQGVMRAVRGSDGSPLWSAPLDMWQHMQYSVNGNSGIAAGDCMGTGETCFITGGWDPDDEPPRTTPDLAHRHGGIIAFGSDGRFLWVTREAQLWWGAPAIARLLGPKGPAQVVVGNGVFDGATGKTLCPQTNAGGSIGGNGEGTLTAIADVDLDGIPEIVTGNQAFKLVADAKSPTGYTCQALYGQGVHMTNGQTCPGGVDQYCPEGFPALANFAGYGATMGLKPDDPHPEIVVVSHGYMSIHDWTGGMMLSPIPLPQHANGIDCDPDFNLGGAPTIADFDGDGLPEIGVASQSAYSVWKPGKGWIWSTPTYDCSANTGSSVFDFEGKGNATVVYSDQCNFHVFDGKTGATLISEPNLSCTAYEMPLVADIDGSGRAKILVPNNNICDFHTVCSANWAQLQRMVGLKALKSPTDKWVNTRSVWNEHTYHVTNVNLDGTLPWPEPNSWDPKQSNSYRQNVQGQGVFSSPDLSACEVRVDMTNCRTAPATATTVVYNGGAIPAMPGITVDFYAVFPDGSMAHIGQALTQKTLQPGDSETVSVPWPAPPQSQAVQVKAVVDEQQVVGDCHPENNTATTAGPVKCSPFG